MAPERADQRGGSEMQAAAQMHGHRLSQLNGLVRWQVLSSLILLALAVFGAMLLPLFHAETGLSWSGPLIPLIIGAILLMTGGIGMKFLPSSLGSNPHVYSLTMALWSFWTILIGSLSATGILFLLAHTQLSTGYIHYLLFASQTAVLIGTLILTYNLWKSMENRV